MPNRDDKTILNEHTSKQEMVNSTTTKLMWMLDFEGTKKHISVWRFLFPQVLRKHEVRTLLHWKIVQLLNLSYSFHCRKVKLADWATKFILNEHWLCLPAKLLTSNTPLPPLSYLDDIVHKNFYTQIKPGGREHPVQEHTLNVIQEYTISPGCAPVPLWKEERTYPVMKVLYNTFQILPWHKCYFLTKHVTRFKVSHWWQSECRAVSKSRHTAWT